MIGFFERILLIVVILIIIFVLLTCGILFKNKLLDSKAKTIRFKELIGTYHIDTSRTNFSSYQKDKEKYSHLTLILNSDSTFQMNMNVPFIYDSIGTWNTSRIEIDEMNHLIYKSNPEIITQFSKLYKSANDSVIFFNAEVGKKNMPFIQEIYFIKDHI